MVVPRAYSAELSIHVKAKGFHRVAVVRPGQQLGTITLDKQQAL